MEWMMVALGGGVGATLRYSVIKLSTRLNYPTYYATVIVNLLGSFLLGLVLQMNISDIYIAFFAIGILGAFTTFSTFAFDLFQLLNDRKLKKSALYLISNLVGGLLLFAVGYTI